MLRQAAVAGIFYPADKESVSEFIKDKEKACVRDDAGCVLVPHAGYVYSGNVLVRTLSSIRIPNSIILAGPNHTGEGADLSVYPEGSWSTPFGDVPVDGDTVSSLCSSSPFVKDSRAHICEHSLEVILPVLKYFNPDIKVTFITMKHLGLETIREAAAHITESFEGLFVVSSDFNHFEDADTTEKKDKAAIDKLLSMDEEGLYKTVAQMRISMCGVIPACVGIVYSRLKGFNEPVFLEHTHSGMVNGDNDRVVGYAGLYYK